MFSPLEQFHIIPVSVIEDEVFDTFDTNLDYHYILLTILLYLLFRKTSQQFKIIPPPVMVMLEEIYMFILSTVEQQASVRGLAFFPIILFNFIFILAANLTSLIPFSFTVTAEFLSVLLLALTFNLFFFYLGLRLNGFKFFYLFFRKDLSLPLRLFLLPIEIFSYSLRTVSLSVRLFANMMAGHTLLHIICGFIIYTLPTVPLGIDIFLILIIIAIFMLECMVAFLQAFIFTILLCIYLNDALNPVH